MTNVHVRSYERKRPSRDAAFIATTKALAAEITADRELESWLAMGLEDALDAEQFNDVPEADKRRMREAF